MEERHTKLKIEEISYDPDNPRIKKALEKYGDNIDAQRIYFALRSASENGTRGVPSYDKLKGSILASGGVMAPITVVNRDNKYVCIDGNTRLAIYKQFVKEGMSGSWSEIKAVVLDDANECDIETIRVSAHLVGSRQWPAYEKARYLHYLRNQKFMDYNEMIALCGGNKKEIERQIDAYHDMNEFYRDVVDDDSSFKIERYSGFVELQKPSIKEAIFEAGLDLSDFGEWIRDGKIDPLATVRQLPKVLGDDEAKNIFIGGGYRSIGEAIKFLDLKHAKDDRGRELTLETASVYELAEILTRRINKLPFEEIDLLRKKERAETTEQIGILENLSERLKGLLENVSE